MEVRPMDRAQFEIHSAMELKHWWFLGRCRVMRELVRLALPPSPSAQVVDFGCGTGANLAALAGDYDARGVESSEEAIAIAKTAFPGITVYHGDGPESLARLGLKPKLLLLMDVLEHVEDDRGLLGGLLEALEPGAQVLLTVPAGADLWSKHDVSLGHFRRYDREGLAALWRGQAVEVRLLSYFNARLFPLVKAARLWHRLAGDSFGDEGTDLKLPPAPVNALLASLFAGEARVLGDALLGRRKRAYRRGVSLVAVLRRVR